MDEQEFDGLNFITEPKLKDQFEGPRPKKKILIFPVEKDWDFTILSCFLNELDSFTKKKGFCRTYENKYIQNIHSFKFFDMNQPNIKIIVSISSKIQVTISRDWIFTEGSPWTKDSSVFFSKLRQRNRLRVQFQEQVHYFYRMSFPKLSNGSNAMLFNVPILYTGIYDYSTIFHYFVKKKNKIDLRYNYDTKFIHEYYDLFMEKNNINVNSFESFKKSNKGYLKLNIQNVVKKRRLAKIIYKEKEEYILNGIFVSNYAKSILTENKISGLMVDTTWKVMSHYVTSILMAIIGNTGIPLSFSFGLSENTELYDLHYEAFKKLEINLADFTIESDKGPAIKSFCDEHAINQIYCLRHLLNSLKYKEFSYQVGLLVKCASVSDFEMCKSTLEEEFSEINDQTKLAALNKTLGKVGLIFSENKITEIDSELWKKCSMLHRVSYRMPSTTNSLEATHGHLNKETPRANEFWASMERLAKTFDVNEKLINDKIRHNYNYAKNITTRKFQNTEKESMQSQIEFYNSSDISCYCSENKIVSQLLEIDLPCSHRLACGTQFPKCPQFSIQINETFDHLVDDDIIEIENDEINIIDEYNRNKEYATAIIRRYSNFKDVDKIMSYVEHSYCSESDNFFILNKPVSLIQLIDEGVSYFTDMKAKFKEEKNKIKKIKK